MKSGTEKSTLFRTTFKSGTEFTVPAIQMWRPLYYTHEHTNITQLIYIYIYIYI